MRLTLAMVFAFCAMVYSCEANDRAKDTQAAIRSLANNHNESTPK